MFKCGGISQPKEGPNICVFGETADTTTFAAAACKDVEDKPRYCQAFEWQNPGQAGNQTCGEKAPEVVFPTVITYQKNVGLDGDSCNNTADHCLSSAKNTPTCNENVCTSSIKAGEACDANTDVPRGHDCTNNVATPLIKDGEECDPANSRCGFQSTCVPDVEQEDGTKKNLCIGIWGAPVGAIWKDTVNDPPFEKGTTFESQNCELNTAFALDGAGRVQCRKPFKNAKGGEEGLRRDNITSTCPGTMYTDEDEKKYDTAVEGTFTQTALCGFNKVDNAYCPYQFGDDEVLKAAGPWIEATQKLDCNKFTVPDAKGGKYCADKLKIEQADGAFKQAAALALGTSAQMSVNAINNDKCVAETIMADFWQGNFDSALAHGVLGVCASLLAFILL